MSVEIVTFGCRLNAFESEAIRRRAAEAGLASAVIVNTCAVTSEAERQARQAIRRARRERPEARIIVTGCAAQIRPDAYAAMDEVDLVLGNREKLLAESYAPAPARVAVGPREALGEAETPLVQGFSGRARAFVEVQHGCDHACTFCIIPMGRGQSRSVPLGAIARQARELVAAGYRELVLTGVDIASFGRDLPGQPSLGQLCRRLLALVPELERLRLSSLDPAAIDDALWHLIGAEPRLMPHLHLSVQAADDLVLKRMRRRHLRQGTLELCRRARALRPGIALGADLIAGFPTEDEAMFERTLAFIDEAALDYLHVFPFSPRPGTPAARMPQVPPATAKERARRLREAGAAALRRALAARVGSLARVLIESGGRGRSEHDAAVDFSASGIEAGSVTTMRIIASTGATLVGVPE
ncbi:MAG TPA: tRNA (N(6)-L-threonylcarbamoyladenosine(37)-C(2))-methylthiotransferase MtaB [Stellaceae bacterium]|nr:tRNA (N(6)-L-threonylcarbamoyladenosine(37)-C(2))-methylthiotransferase MtaB [Stellaceae bacterium]